MGARRWNKTALVRVGRAIRKELGRDPLMREFAAQAGVGDATIRKHFGSWEAFAAQVSPGAAKRKAVSKAKATSKPPERFVRTPRDVRAIENATDIFVTCGVSNSPAALGALRSLEHAAEECGGTIAITPIRYKNPTTREEAKRARPEEWWADELKPYLIENELRPHPLLSIMTTRAQATSHNPLPARVSGRTKDRSAIFGHPQLSMRTVATPHNRLPKMLYSSGAVTERAYSDTLAGDMADFHHSIAAIKVEIRGDRVHMRELTWDGEKFLDLDRAYTPKGVTNAPRPEALIMGDVHAGVTAKNVLEATFGAKGIVPTLKPKREVFHDLSDALKVNPHERGRALAAAAHAGLRAVDDLKFSGEFLERATRSKFVEEFLVVDSNHNDFWKRWLDTGRPEPIDAELFHWLTWRMLKHQREEGRFPNAFEVALREHCKIDERVRFLGLDESYRVGSIELGMHGHLGPNGSRGSVKNLSYIGSRSVIGHVHSPAIWQGVYAVGTSSEYRLGYNAGPSSWHQTHAIVHANTYRQLIHIVGESWRG